MHPHCADACKRVAKFYRHKAASFASCNPLHLGETNVLRSCIHHGLGVGSTSSHHLSHLGTGTNSVHNSNRLEEADNAKTQGDARKVEGQQAEAESLPRG